MTDALTVSDLRDLRLTSKEWTALWNLGIHQCCPARAGASDEVTDALVLAGLIARERNETDTDWIESWVMTQVGLGALTVMELGDVMGVSMCELLSNPVAIGIRLTSGLHILACKSNPAVV